MNKATNIQFPLIRNFLTGHILVYLTGVGFVIGAFLLRSLLQPLIGEETWFVLFYTAIMAAAWRGGLCTGLLATASAALLQLYASPAADEISTSYLIELVLFILEGVLISFLVYRLRVNYHQLATSQEHLQLALEVANISLYTNDHDLKYTWISHIHPKLSLSDIVGKRDEEVLPKASVAELIALKQKVIATGQRRQQFIHTTINNEAFSFFVIVDPIVTSNNNVSGVTVAALDVTDATRLQLALEDQKHFTDTILHAMPAVAYVFNIQTMESQVVNNYATEVLGYTHDQIIEAGPLFQNIVHPDDQPIIRAHITNLVSADRSQAQNIEYRMRHKNGQWLWFSAEEVVFRRDDAGAILEILGVAQEITSRKQTEDALRSSEEKFKVALKNTSSIVAQVNRDLQYTWLNNPHPAFDPISSLGKNDVELNPVEGSRQLMALKRRVLETEQGAHENIAFELPDGIHTYAITAEPLVDSSGAIKGVTTAALDVTKYEHLQSQLRESEARFQNMADYAPMMVWVTEADGSCSYLSQSWYEFTGQNPETGLGFGWLEATHPADRERAYQIFTKASERQEAFSIDYRLRRTDGEYRWAIDAARPRFSQDGEFVGYIGSVIDITERKRMEEALRVSEEKYRTLFSSIDEGFCICEILVDKSGHPRDYRFLETNPMFEPHTGLKGALGKTALELVPNLEQHWVDMYGKVALTGEPVRFTQDSDVMGRWFDVYSFRLGDPEKRQFAILFTDITERKQAEEILQQQRAILQQLVDSLPVMITLYEPDGRILYLNDEFERLTGWNSETIANVDFAAEVYPDPEYRKIIGEYMQSLEPGWREVKIIARDGSIIASSWTNIRLVDGRLVGIGIDIRERLRHEKRNHILRTVAIALSSALNPPDVTKIILEQAIEQSEAVAGTIAILSPDELHLEIVETYGYPDQIVDKWRTIPLDHPTAPVALAVREERNLWMRSPEEREQIIPTTPGLKPEEQHPAWAVLPFNIDNQLRGVFALGFDTPQIFDENEQAFLLTLTNTCAQALRRAYLSEKLKESAAVEERNRLARDLHDAVKQMLFASSAMAEVLPGMIERKPEQAQEVSLEISRLNHATLAEMQILLQTMRPEIIIGTSFKSLLENLCKKLEGMRRIETILYWNGPNEFYLPEEVHTALYRLAQEAFNNITKHSEASQVNVHCTWNENNFDLNIHDNGQGFDLKRTSGGLGMNTMRERATLVEAEFNIKSTAGAGTQITVTWRGEIR